MFECTRGLDTTTIHFAYRSGAGPSITDSAHNGVTNAFGRALCSMPRVYQSTTPVQQANWTARSRTAVGLLCAKEGNKRGLHLLGTIFDHRMYCGKHAFDDICQRGTHSAHFGLASASLKRPRHTSIRLRTACSRAPGSR